MIRDATIKDTAQMLEIAMRFNDKYYPVPLNPAKFVDAFENIINSGVGVVLMTDTSAIVGVFTDDPFRDWRALVEVGWYSETGDGLRLLQEFERRGRDVDEVRMCTLNTSPTVADKMLIRRGYRLIERSYSLTR